MRLLLQIKQKPFHYFCSHEKEKVFPGKYPLEFKN